MRGDVEIMVIYILPYFFETNFVKVTQGLRVDFTKYFFIVKYFSVFPHCGGLHNEFMILFFVRRP